MSRAHISRRLPPRPAALRLKIGSWLEAQASGWAVILVPLVVALLILGAWLA